MSTVDRRDGHNDHRGEPELPAAGFREDPGPGPEGFAEVLSRAVAQRGLTLAEISAALRHWGVHASVSSLSSWQSGARHPDWTRSKATMDALEQVLELPVGTLADRISLRRRQGRPPGYGSVAEVMSPQPEVREALTDLGFHTAADFPHELFVTERAVLEADVGLLTLDFHLVLRALQDGPCAVPSLHVLDPEEAVAPPRITALEGCTVGTVREWGQQRIAGAAVHVTGRMEAGELARVAFRVQFEGDLHGVTEVTYAVARRAHGLFMEVDVSRCPPLIDAAAFSRQDSSDGQGRTSSVAPSARGLLHLVERSFGPGQIGVRWSWAD